MCRDQNAPFSLLGSSWYCSECNPWSAASPSAVRSGRPTGVTAPVKNLGFHSLLAAFLSAAFCLCFSSISVLRFVASEYCLPTIACVTPSQNLSDSLGNCSSSGGTTLGTGSSGLRSMIRFFSYLSQRCTSFRASWVAYGYFGKRLVAKRVIHLVLPVSFYPCEHVFLWNVLDLHDVVILGVILVNDALDLVLCAS